MNGELVRHIYLHPFTSHHTFFAFPFQHTFAGTMTFIAALKQLVLLFFPGRLVSLLHPSQGTLQNQRGISNKTKSSLIVCNIAVQTLGCNAFVDVHSLKTLKEFANVSSFV